jgi:hypothetical protein
MTKNILPCLEKVVILQIEIQTNRIMEATMVFDYDPSDAMAQKVVAFVRSLGIFHERSLDLDEAIKDAETGNVEDYDNVDDFFKEHNLL